MGLGVWFPGEAEVFCVYQIQSSALYIEPPAQTVTEIKWPQHEY